MAAAVARSAQAEGVASSAALRCLKTNGDGGGGGGSGGGVEDCIRGLQYDPVAAWQAAHA